MENTKKQTVLDWFLSLNMDSFNSPEDLDKAYQQAKKMEESNVCEFAIKAIAEFSQKGKININDFYNQTYNTETDGL